MSNHTNITDKLGIAINVATKKIFWHIDLAQKSFSEDIVKKALETRMIISLVYWTCHHSYLDADCDIEDTVSLHLVVREVFSLVYGKSKYDEFLQKAYEIMDVDEITTKKAFKLASEVNYWADFNTQCMFVQLPESEFKDRFIGWGSFNNRISRLFEKANTEDERNTFQEIISEDTKLIEQNLNTSDAYSDRGYAKTMLCDYQGAISDLNIAISLNPNDPNYYYNRGRAFFNLGEKIKAYDDFMKSGELGYRVSKDFLDACLK